MWCIPAMDAEFLYRMEDVLDLYARPHDPTEPVVCLDETSVQLIAETRTPPPVAPGEPERFDSEYERKGTANLFMLVEPRGGWRLVAVTDHRTKQDFADQLRALALEQFPEARTIHLVLDNPNTHPPGLAVRTVSGARGARDRPAIHPPSDTGARKLAEHGGDRALDPGESVPPAPHRGSGGPGPGDRGLGGRAQREARNHRLVVHDRQGPREDGSPLPVTSSVLKSWS